MHYMYMHCKLVVLMPICKSRMMHWCWLLNPRMLPPACMQHVGKKHAVFVYVGYSHPAVQYTINWCISSFSRMCADSACRSIMKRNSATTHWGVTSNRSTMLPMTRCVHDGGALTRLIFAGLACKIVEVYIWPALLKYTLLCRSLCSTLSQATSQLRITYVSFILSLERIA